MIVPNVDSPTETVAVSVKFKVKGTLKERIRGVELILAIKEHGVMSIAGNDFPVKFSDTDLSSIRVKEQNQKTKKSTFPQCCSAI